MAGVAPLTIAAVAELCHEVNRAYCTAIGDGSQRPWAQAEQWQRDSAVNGVRHRLLHPFDPPSASHENWLREKLEGGWVYGPVKDAEKKEHPCCVPFDELPADQKVKDYLFACVVMSLRDHRMIAEAL